jgi:hypothetical protein
LLEQKYINLFHLYKKVSKTQIKIKIKENLGMYKKCFEKKTVWIFKNIYGSEGKGIFIVSSWTELCSIIIKIMLDKKIQELWKKLKYNKYKKLTNNKKFTYQIEWVLQEYITNPLLINNRKFHLRGYLLYHIDSKKRNQAFYFNNYRVFTALEAYKTGEYFNKKIHDSHFVSTVKELNFDTDIVKIIPNPKMDSILKQLLLINKSIMNIVKAKCYATNKSCYHLFASDIMITEDYICKLIEVNHKPGMSSYANQKVDYQNLIFKSIFHNIVEPTFINKKVKETEKYHFIKL